MVSGNWRGGLEKLVEELRRQKETKIDFVADTRSVKFVPDDTSGIRLASNDCQVAEFVCEPLKMSERAISQFGDRMPVSVPSKFSKEMAVRYPEILCDLYNSMGNSEGNRVMFRCLDGKVRAALSSKYRIFDDLDIAFAALETIKQNRGSIIECNASDSKMEIKFTALHMVEHISEDRGGDGSSEHISRSTIDPNKLKEYGKGAVCPFVRISHSSVGEGGLGISYGLMRMWCMNGAIMEKMMNQVHLGSSIGNGLLSEETIAADSKAIMLKARDLISASLAPETFKRLVTTARDASLDDVKSPTAAVELLVGNAGLTEEAQDNILAYFLRDYDQNRWGLAQAVSRYSQDVNDFEEASNLENVSGRLIRGRELITSSV